MSRELNYTGGVGIRIYPRTLLEPLGFRPADENLGRGCDTSILVNVTRRFQQDRDNRSPRVTYGDLHHYQVVDWKTRGQQLNSYRCIGSVHRRGTDPADPFEALADHYPADALEQMARHYRRTSPSTQPGAFSMAGTQHEEVQ